MSHCSIFQSISSTKCVDSSEKEKIAKTEKCHCVKSVRIRKFSGPYFLAFGLNTDQKNVEYEHVSHSVSYMIFFSDLSIETKISKSSV